jgi:hypothetical protein
VFEGKPELIPVKGNPKRLRVSLKISVDGKDRQLISCRDGANEKVDMGALHTPFSAGVVEFGRQFVIIGRDSQVFERAELGLQFPALGLVGDPR